jgi:hypothetical protein
MLTKTQNKKEISDNRRNTFHHFKLTFAASQFFRRTNEENLNIPRKRKKIIFSS